MKILNIAYIFFLLLFWSCSNQQTENNESNSLTNIIVDNYKNVVIDINKFTTTQDTTLLLPEENVIAPVKDLCMIDSMIYILDHSKTISVFDTRSGNIIKTSNMTGQGPGEYVDPNVIISERDTIYILDLQSASVLVYNKNLEYIKNIRIKFPALDFIKIDNGFLFYNLNVTKDIKDIVHTDLNGNIINSFSISERENDVILTKKVFSKDEHENVYISAPVSNTIYEWKSNNINKAFFLDFGNKISDSKKNSQVIYEQEETMIGSYITSKYIITLFKSNRMVYTNIYDRKEKKSYSGIVRTGISTAFSPKCIYNNTIVDIYEQYIETEEIFDEHIVFVRYNLK